MPKRAVRVTARGIVQGVFFRASMADFARGSRVSGWVRNRVDGSVEALLEGEEDDVSVVIEWARTGPPRARVDTLTVEEAEFRNLKGFRVD